MILASDFRKVFIISETEQNSDSVISAPTRTTETARLRMAQMSIESGLSLGQIVKEACRISAETLRVDRVGYWVLVENQDSLQCAIQFEAPRNGFRDGAVLQLTDIPNFFAALGQRKILSSEIAQHDPLLAEFRDSYLKPLNITSVLDAPIFVAGKVNGFLRCEHVGNPRDWSTEDRDFAASIADLIGLKTRASEVLQLRQLLNLTEDRLIEQGRSQISSTMAAGVAHDFRNVLTAIVNSAEVIGNSNSWDVVRECVDIIMTAAKRGTDLIRGLSDLGKDDSRPASVLNVESQVMQFLPLLCAAVGKLHQINPQIESGLGMILINAEHLLRILTNLVVNSKEAMPNGGAIEVRAVHWKSPNERNADWVAIEVRDHGNGMDDNVKKKLFEPYFTTKATGTGLGMPIVKRLAEKTGGRIEVESQLNVGTTIRVIFPVVSN